MPPPMRLEVDETAFFNLEAERGAIPPTSLRLSSSPLRLLFGPAGTGVHFFVTSLV